MPKFSMIWRYEVILFIYFKTALHLWFVLKNLMGTALQTYNNSERINPLKAYQL